MLKYLLPATGAASGPARGKGAVAGRLSGGGRDTNWRAVDRGGEQFDTPSTGIPTGVRAPGDGDAAPPEGVVARAPTRRPKVERDSVPEWPESAETHGWGVPDSGDAGARFEVSGVDTGR